MDSVKNPDLKKPRGATSIGAEVTLDAKPNPLWIKLQDPSLTKFEKDRLAILNSTKDNRMPTERLRMIAKRNPYEIEKVIKALLKKASDGDVSAIKEVFDRLDGKVVNQISAEVSDNRPIYVVTGIDNEDDEHEDNAIVVDTGFRDE